jgi:hypothetical protein
VLQTINDLMTPNEIPMPPQGVGDEMPAYMEGEQPPVQDMANMPPQGMGIPQEQPQ